MSARKVVVPKRAPTKTKPALRGGTEQPAPITEADIKRRMEGLRAADGSVDLIAEWMTEAEIRQLPPPECLIERWVPRKGVVVLYGEPGIGKTLQLIAWTKHVQRGEPWHGLHVRQGPVLFIEGETLEGFGPRLEAFNAAVKLPTGAVEAEARYIGMPTNLSSPKAILAVILAGRQLMKEAGEPLAMVVIDPLIENMSGDENGDGMDEASRALRIIAEELECVVVVGHHSNAEGGRERGNQKLRARVHVVVRMETIDPTTVGLVVQKQRNGERRAMRLSKDPVADSIVLTPFDHVSEHEYEAQKGERQQAAKDGRKKQDDEAKLDNARKALRDRLPTKEADAVGIDAARRKLLRCGVRTDTALDLMRTLADEGEIKSKPGTRNSILFWWPK